MTPSRLVLATILVCLSVLAMPVTPACSQQSAQQDNKQRAALEKMQQMLEEPLIERKAFPKEMPLAKLLDALEKHLPENRKVSLRIDKEDFGDKFAEVASTVVPLVAASPKISLGMVLDVALTRLKTDADYRLGPEEIVITTPERALYTKTYEIRDILAKPETVSISPEELTKASEQQADLRRAEPTQRTARLVRAIIAGLDQTSRKTSAADRETFKALNATQLVIRTTPSRHALIANLLTAFRRLGDVAVISTAKLYEVDDAFYAKLKKVKPVDPEELDRIILEGGAPKRESLFDQLPKQRLVLAGEEVKVDNGQQAALLSRQQAVLCGPGQEQVRKSDKTRHAVLVGVSFQALVQVSPDRRYVRLNLVEKGVELDAIRKFKVMVSNEGDLATAEVPLLRESTHSRVLDLPDGGSILFPVQHRPRELQEKNRWLVLSLTTRIYIEEEEHFIRQGSLEAILPVVAADVLKNPRLKHMRDLYGTPGDKRFVLVDSAAWTWTPDSRPKLQGVERVPGKRVGQRLVGIRVEKYEPATEAGIRDTVTVSLVNAGGNENGEVVGAGTVRYAVRQEEKGWVVQLLP